ncbi:hypothetical protein EBR96_05875, partial [bacterium]|nr:hypothetical protein [bacterium]
MYNATNGRVVYAATNPLTFTNASLELGDVVLNSGGVFGYGREIYLEEGTISGEWTFNNAFSVNNASNAAVIRTNLSLGWPALTNSNSATQLLGVNTNGQVIANTGTNVLTFTNSVQVQNISVGYNIFSVGTDYDTFRGRFGNGDTGALEVHTTLDAFDIDPVTSPNYSGIASVGQGNVA